MKAREERSVSAEAKPILAFCAASCQRAPAPPAPRVAPARALVVTDGHLSLRSSAYVELHAWLAAAARSDEEVPPELDAAKRAYARALQDDDEDALLGRTTRAIEACGDDPCASAAASGEGFGYAYARALPLFVQRWWLPRATAAWAAVEASHAVLGLSSEALLDRAASDLAIPLPALPIPVAVVSAAPAASRGALIPTVLSARGRCFVRDARPEVDDPAGVHDARLIDCILVHALLGTSAGGPLHDAIVRHLGARDGEQAWSLLVIHGVAAILTAWEAHHLSVYRRSALAVEGSMLAWLAKEWRGSSSEPAGAFAGRFAARWAETHRGGE